MFISCSSEHLQWWKTAQEGIDQDRWFLCADYSWRTRLNIWYLITNLTRRDIWYLITNSSYYLGWNNSGWCIGSQIELWHDWDLFKCYRFWKRLERKFYCVFLVHYDTSPFYQVTTTRRRRDVEGIIAALAGSSRHIFAQDSLIYQGKDGDHAYKGSIVSRGI